MTTLTLSQPATRTRPIGIGGTDIGAILGLSPYKTPLELWSELVSGDDPVPRDLLHLRYGQHTESFVSSEYERLAKLVLQITEVVHLHPPLVYQGIKAIVQAAGGHPQQLGNLALRHIRPVLQDAQHPEVDILL